MTGKWELKPLGELCLLINRGVAPAYVEQGGILVINQKCIRNHHVSLAEAKRTDPKAKRVPEDRLLRPFDVLVNSTGVGTLGRVAQVKKLSEPATVDSHVTIIRPDPRKIYPHYLGFALEFKQPEIEALAEGSTGQIELPRARLRGLEIPIPPFPSQRAIAHILGTLDDKIELLRRMNETLEAMARALFKSWFVDFDPVIDNALEAGNPIPDELKEKAKRRLALGERRKLLPEHIRRLFPDRFVDSELGPIPDGWACKQLGQLVSIVKGRSYKSSELAPSDTALVTLKSFHRGGGYKPDGLKPYIGKYSAEQVVRPGELVIALTDVTQQAEVIGKPAIVRQDRRYRTLVASLDTAIIRPLDDRVTIPFLYCLLLSSDFQNHAYGHCTGTTVLHLSKDALPTYQFAYPPEELIVAYTRLSAPAFSKTDLNHAEIATLGALRDTLLPKLISGEVRVRGEKKILEGLE